MKRRIITAIAIIAFIAGLSLLLYPTVSNYYNVSKHRRAIFNYLVAAESMEEEDYSAFFEKARAYNKALAQQPLKLMELTDAQKKEYESLLDITGTGIIGYIEINKADIFLPIYHGTREAVLQVGVGHLEGSSLPIGGESTHSILSGHRGLPSALLFTNLDRLKEGDRFVIRVLDEAFEYKVTDITVIEPAAVDSLSIEKGRDICTLMTCTPYGINTHRLLVRGDRVHKTIEQEKISIQSGASTLGALPLLIAVEIPVLVLSVIFFSRRGSRKYAKMKKR